MMPAQTANVIVSEHNDGYQRHVLASISLNVMLYNLFPRDMQRPALHSLVKALMATSIPGIALGVIDGAAIKALCRLLGNKYLLIYVAFCYQK